MVGMDGGAGAPLADGSACAEGSCGGGCGAAHGSWPADRVKREYVKRAWVQKLAMVRDSSSTLVTPRLRMTCSL